MKKSVGFGSPVSEEIKILEQSNKKENFADQLKINDSFLKVCTMIFSLDFRFTN